jgi:hypothetical protein
MTDTIVKQRECFTIALTTEVGPAIPYPSADHENGRRNYGFVDLRTHPHLIAQVPEAIGKPGLIELLQYLNSDLSPVMTLGCENGVFLCQNQNADGPTCYVGSYVDLAFRDPYRNSQEEIVLLASNLMEERKPEARQWTTFELIVQPMRHFFGNSAHNLMLKIAAHGRSESEAWSVFDAQCQSMINPFKRVLCQMQASSKSS